MLESDIAKMPSNAAASADQLTATERYLVSLFRRLNEPCQRTIVGTMTDCVDDPLLQRRTSPVFRLVKGGAS